MNTVPINPARYPVPSDDVRDATVPETIVEEVPPVIGAIKTVMGHQPLREHDNTELPVTEDRQWFGREAKDTRPEYSPASVVLDVKAALGRAGIDVEATTNQLHTASIAAADLLRALGVRPATAPRRGRPIL